MWDRTLALLLALPIWSVPRVPCRFFVSGLFAIVFASLWIHHDWLSALWFTTVLFLSVAWRELVRAGGARLLGTELIELFLWPGGGVARWKPAPISTDWLFLGLLGPAGNLMVCLAMAPFLFSWSDRLWDALNPFVLPVSSWKSGSMLQTTLISTFWCHWMLFLVQVLPVCPLDGSAIVLGLLRRTLPIEMADRLTHRTTVVSAGLILVVGLLGTFPWLIGLGALGLLLAIGSNPTAGTPSSASAAMDSEEEALFGYDFSQGYTSLEQSSKRTSAEPAPSFWELWQARRKRERERREAEERQAAEALLDTLLGKVYSGGMDSLTARERRTLKRLSDQYRGRQKGPTS